MNRITLGMLSLVSTVPLAACAAQKAAPASETPSRSEQQQPATERAPAADTQGAPGAAPPAAAGAGMPRSTSGEATKSPAIEEGEQLSRDLDRVLALSTPDCTMAWSLRDRICDLAQRLCDLAARSAEADVGERCTDGRARCERATTRVRASCAQ